MVDTVPSVPEEPAAEPAVSASAPVSDQPVVDISDEKLMAALAYIGFLVFIPLLTRKGNPYIHFHVKQGLAIFLGEVIAVFAVQWLAAVGNILFALLLLASVVGLIQALQGKKFRIPGIGNLADKFSV